MRRVTRNNCVSGPGIRPADTANTQAAFPNITHYGHALAMFYPKHRRTADVRCTLDADDNSDSEVKRARSRGT
jgi:hypothetical protein